MDEETAVPVVETPAPIKINIPAPVESDWVSALGRAFHPIALAFPLAVMLPVCLLTADSFNFADGGYVVATFLFFAAFSLSQGVATWAIHCRTEGSSFGTLLVPYLKRSHVLLPPMLLSLLFLAPLSLTMGLAFHIESSAGSFGLLAAGALALIACAFGFTLTAGYWCAVGASQVSGVRETFDGLCRMFGRSFRTMARHSMLALLVSFGVFACAMLPSLAVALMHFKSPSPPIDMKHTLLVLDFAVATALSIATLSAMVVHSAGQLQEE